MEIENIQNNVTLFVKHIFLFMGGLFMALIGLIMIGDYQVGWKKADSERETVINQVNTEVVMNHVFKDQEMNSRGKR